VIKIGKNFNDLKKELFLVRRLLEEGYGPRYWWPYVKNRFLWRIILPWVPKFDYKADPNLELHTICNKKELWMLVWMLRSFLVMSKLRPVIVINDDGTLDKATADLIHSKFSNVKIIFSDFNEFSYKLTLDGLENYSTTICKSLSRSGGNNIPTAEQKLGKYYVEPDVEYYLINQIGNKLDDCFFCRLIHKTPLGKNIDKNLWKYVRLGHFIIAKNNESNKINKAKNKGQLKEGVHDMFANSKNLKSLA